MNTRRDFIRRTSLMGAGLTALSTGLFVGNSLAKDNIELTDVSFENDLITHPFDETITIEGKILDKDRISGLANATVEIWHCDAAGYFKQNGKFTHKGKVKTSTDGTYHFKTNVPGRYKEAGITKSKRIFVKVSARGYQEQFSTLYLDCDNYPFIDSDHFQNSRLFDINDLPEKVANGKNSTIRYNHYLV